jgi:hypothetical protein
MKTFIFDMDETICYQKNKDHYEYYLDNLIPDNEMISYINKLYERGHPIIIMTGRGAVTGIDWSAETRMQLSKWGVKYTELRFIKKPLDYLYVDDKACSPKAFVEEMRYVL